MQWSNTSDQYICVGAKDNSCYVFSTVDGQVIMKTTVNKKAVQQALFTHDDKKVLVMGLDQRLSLHSLVNRQQEDQTQNVKFYEDMALVQDQQAH